jgi:hypothetical protein
MKGCEEEPNRVAGFPVSRARRYGEEPQHAMGVPLAWQEPVRSALVRVILHPVSAWRARHREA